MSQLVRLGAGFAFVSLVLAVTEVRCLDRASGGAACRGFFSTKKSIEAAELIQSVLNPTEYFASAGLLNPVDIGLRPVDSKESALDREEGATCRVVRIQTDQGPLAAKVVFSDDVHSNSLFGYVVQNELSQEGLAPAVRAVYNDPILVGQIANQLGLTSHRGSSRPKLIVVMDPVQNGWNFSKGGLKSPPPFAQALDFQKLASRLELLATRLNALRIQPQDLQILVTPSSEAYLIDFDYYLIYSADGTSFLSRSGQKAVSPTETENYLKIFGSPFPKANFNYQLEDLKRAAFGTLK